MSCEMSCVELASASMTAVSISPEPETEEHQAGGVHKSRSSLSVGPACRICFRGCCEEALVEPCNCRGSIGLVHASCLEKWVTQRRQPRCDICAFAYQVEERSKSYLEMLRDPEARARPLSHLFRAMGLLTCVLFLLPMSCAFVAGLHYSLLSVSLYVFSVGHSMFWFRRPVLYFIEFLKACVEWKRNSTYLKLILPPPVVPTDPSPVAQPPRRLLVLGVLFSLNVALTMPLAWLGAFELHEAVPRVLTFYMSLFLAVISLTWIAVPIACFVIFFMKKCKPDTSQVEMD
ncbi:E3 ubiquitin-protein ligase MARCHF3-like [Haemaphysalis longicornis]